MTNFKFCYNKQNINLDIILPGVNIGIESSLTQKILDLSYKNGYSSLMINYLFYENGKKNISKETFSEEIDNITEIMNLVKYQEYQNIRFIGKSLGAIIAGIFLSKLNENEIQKYSITILGYDTGYINLTNFIGKIHIIQGEFDRYGNIDVVKKDLENAKSKNILYDQIKGADHSFKNPNTGEPEFENEAINKILY